MDLLGSTVPPLSEVGYHLHFAYHCSLRFGQSHEEVITVDWFCTVISIFFKENNSLISWKYISFKLMS